MTSLFPNAVGAARTILHVDMDAFYAAIEQRRRPDLRGRPVVVGGQGDPRMRGVVSTASYEARRFGIHSAMPLRTAYRLCPDAAFLPVDMDTYAQMSDRVYAILRETGAPVEPAGLDEAFLDVSDIPESGEAIARRIKNRIARELGLTASIGVGPNKLIAKIASGLRKPDGLTVIAQEEVEARLAPLPVRVLWGVGPKTAAFLRETFGVTTVGDLAVLSEAQLRTAFGGRHGAHLHRVARGIDENPVVTSWERTSLSRERTFQVDIRDPAAIREEVARLAGEVAEDLTQRGYAARTITLKVRFAPFTTVTRSHTVSAPIGDSPALARVALLLLQRLVLDRPVRLLGVRAAKLLSDRGDRSGRSG